MKVCIKPFMCNICDYKSAQKYKIKFHIASVHEVKKQYHCSLCNIGLSTNQQLEYHNLRFHEGAKPFKCNPRMVNADVKKDPLELSIMNYQLLM